MSKDWTPEEIQAASAAMAAAGQLSYEEFTAEVEAAQAAKARIEAFAKVQADGNHFCPRCGRFSVKDRLHANALSRYIDVSICDECGLDEAVRAMANEPLPLREWTIANGQPKGGSEA